MVTFTRVCLNQIPPVSRNIVRDVLTFGIVHCASPDSGKTCVFSGRRVPFLHNLNLEHIMCNIIRRTMLLRRTTERFPCR